MATNTPIRALIVLGQVLLPVGGSTHLFGQQPPGLQPIITED